MQTATAPLEFRRYGASAGIPLNGPQVCRHCGGNIAGASPIRFGKWSVFPDWVEAHGIIQPLTKQQARICYLLAGMSPRPFEALKIAARLFPQSVSPRNYISRQIHLIRLALGNDCPIRNAQGRGYYWDAPA